MRLQVNLLGKKNHIFSLRKKTTTLKRFIIPAVNYVKKSNIILTYKVVKCAKSPQSFLDLSQKFTRKKPGTRGEFMRKNPIFFKIKVFPELEMVRLSDQIKSAVKYAFPQNQSAVFLMV